ncbi:MAG: serine hydrolase [Verrucomicrobiia bacterium]
MKTFRTFTSSIAPVLVLTGQLLAGVQVAEVPKTTAQPSWPNPDWPRATPAEVGLDEGKLAQARDYALTGGGAGCIIRHGKLVLAWGDPKQLYELKSTTKSFGATALGLAVMDGKVQLDDPAMKFCPDLGVPPDTNAPTGWLDKITLRMWATQTAGFEKPGGFGRLLFEPGTKWHYSDGGPNWLADCLTDMPVTLPGQDVESLTARRSDAAKFITQEVNKLVNLPASASLIASRISQCTRKREQPSRMLHR